MLKIYTPGHSPYTDALIMYSIAFAAGEHLQEVRGLGSSYEIRIEGLTEEELAQRLWVRLADVRAEYSSRLERLVDEKDVNLAADALARKQGLASYLRELSAPGHARDEGRLGDGRNIKLPMMPYAGKYFRVDLTREQKYRAREYVVCPYCFSLSLMGLGLGTVTTAFRTTVVLATFGFEGPVDGRAIEGLLGWFAAVSQGQQELLERVKPDEVPDRVLGNLLLTCLRDDLVVSMDASDATWKSFVVRFETARAVQVRGYSSVELDSVLAALAELVRIEKREAEAGRQPPRCRAALESFLAQLLRYGSVSSLEKLFDFLANRDVEMLYDAVREAYASSKGEIVVGVELANCLLSLST